MTTAERIRTLGFRRWHERQLIECHAYLVTGILSLLLALVCLEELNLRTSGARGALVLMLIMGAAVVCLAALRRYVTMLQQIQRLADRSVCSRCGAFGALRILDGRPGWGGGVGAAPHGGQSLDVECRDCGNRWRMGCDQPT